jgi:hypothetical protein
VAAKLVLLLLVALGVAAGLGAGSRAEVGSSVLDSVAFAVDAAESSHGADQRMWRGNPDGPQGPMQVTAAAAADVGGGDRFDPQQNRLLGRAYLAHMYWRYGSWPDAVAAYNWGPSRIDRWISGGRSFDKLPVTVDRYRSRVLVESGLGTAVGQGPKGRDGSRLAKLGIVHPQPRRQLGAPNRVGNRPDEVELLYVTIMRATEPQGR